MLIFATVNLFFHSFSPDDNTVKSVIMVYRVFKFKSEEKLFKLYYALDKYFNEGYPVSCTGYHDKTGNILPLLYQCFIEFWCKNEKFYSKIIKK